MFPINTDDYEQLRDAVAKMKAQCVQLRARELRCPGFSAADSSACCTRRSSRSVWSEFNLELPTSAPGVRYRVTKTDGEVLEIENPQKMPDPAYSARW
jgi:GTP-binding protein LepA